MTKFVRGSIINLNLKQVSHFCAYIIKKYGAAKKCVSFVSFRMPDKEGFVEGRGRARQTFAGQRELLRDLLLAIGMPERQSAAEVSVRRKRYAQS